MTDRGAWLAALAGALLPLAFAPFSRYWLAPLLLAVLFAAWDRVTPRRAASRGAAFGFAAFLAGTWWLYISIHGFGGSPRWLAVLLMLGLNLLMAAYVAACGWLAARIRARWSWLSWCLAWPAAWTLLEWLRGWLFSGFPWLSLGYGQIDGPLAAWAPLGGVYLVSLLTAIVAGLLLLLWRGSARARLGALAAGLLLVLATGLLQQRHWTVPAGERVRVSLVQGAVSQDRKWLPGQRLPTLRLYHDLSFPGPPRRILLWPEVAIPALADEVGDYLQALHAEARAADSTLLLGILTRGSGDDGFYNALIALGADTGEYHKRHLVPFGEFFPVPGFVREWLRLMSLPYRDMTAGAREQPPLQALGIRLAPSICYEDAFGAEQLDFLPAAALLVNVSNDAWFGDSIAPAQHLQMARMRALEAGRPMLRATNTGITAIIGADGRLQDRLPQFRPGVLHGQVQPRRGATPYVRAGDLPVLGLSLLLVFAGLGSRRAAGD
ncbi:MAG: apolipoprotein N-acyltransferase [Gammaproteobacteria bacterium]|nr:MAG: apolipoprotein N-acyltransferase [Gammaproteobacteria bacterium]